jgi:hypothetical protein
MVWGIFGAVGTWVNKSRIFVRPSPHRQFNSSLVVEWLLTDCRSMLGDWSRVHTKLRSSESLERNERT